MFPPFTLHPDLFEIDTDVGNHLHQFFSEKCCKIIPYGKGQFCARYQGFMVTRYHIGPEGNHVIELIQPDHVSPVKGFESVSSETFHARTIEHFMRIKPMLASHLQHAVRLIG